MTRRFYRPQLHGASPLTTSALVAATVGVLASGAALAAPATSGAATIGVVNCGTVYGDGDAPRNGAYPFRDGTTGFQISPDSDYTQGGRLVSCDTPNNAAPQGLGMRATLEGNYAQGPARAAIWRWVSAPDTKVQRYGARLYTRSRPYDTTQGRYDYGDVFVDHDGQRDPVYDFRTGSGGDNTWKGPITVDKDLASSDGVGFVNFGVRCGAVDMNHNCHADPATPIADINVQGFQAIVSDTSNPQVANVSGDLIDNRYWARTVGATASVTDKGTGVYRVVIQRRAADNTWSDDAAQVVDANSGKCGPLANVKVYSEARVFTSSRPCRTDASGDVTIDTTTLDEGERVYRVMVEDATGNRAAFVGPQTRVIDRTAPTVSFAGTPDQCVAGTRAGVQAQATDSIAGIQSIVTVVIDAKGNKIPVAADGTIECPSAAAGPLAVTTTATDKAGNSATLSRGSVVAVKDAPVPVIVNPGSGAIGNANAIPNAPAPAPAPAPGTTPAPAPVPAPVVNKVEAAAKIAACSSKGVVLTEVVPSGRKDILRGVAPTYVGQTVVLTYGPYKKVVARLPVGVDGTFTATVTAPRGRGARGNLARYQATVGKETSSALKRIRRMYSTLVFRAQNGRVYASGRLTKPFRKGTVVAVKVLRSSNCSDYRTVARLRVDRTGSYGAQLPVTESGVVVRAVAQVPISKRIKRLMRTQTLPSAVQ